MPYVFVKKLKMEKQSATQKRYTNGKTIHTKTPPPLLLVFGEAAVTSL